MLRLFNRLAHGYERYMTYRAREMARSHLLKCNDRLLADNGFSRELLEQGSHAWPWLGQNDQGMGQPVVTELVAREYAIRELSGMSDRDLRDLALSRGQITQAVDQGRTGIDTLPDNPRAAA